MIAELFAQFDYRLFKPLYTVTVSWLLTPWVLAGLASVFVLQLLIPARPGEKSISTQVLADWVWFFYAQVMGTLVLTTYVIWVSSFLKPYFSSLQLTALAAWPVWARFIVVFLFIDFMSWLFHYAMHKSSILWQFHAVHHSQTQLNFFSDFRIHIVDHLFRATFVSIPLIVLDAQLPTVVAFVIFETWYPPIYHSNLKLNFGPLKYVLVTPQSHRFHHINDVRMRDRNFGRFLTVWDWIFGTQAKEWNAYPATGIEDRSFPLEPVRPTVRLLWLPIVQQFYPFKTLALSAWRRLNRRDARRRAALPPVAAGRQNSD